MGTIVKTDDTNYYNIANAIREKTETEDLIKPSEMEVKISAVYNKGREKMTETWWNMMSQDGTRTDWSGAFWHTDLDYVNGFNPPQTIKPTAAGSMFYGAKGVGNVTSLAIDFSNCTALNSLFYNSDVESVEILDARSCSGALYSTFLNANELVTIGELRLKEDGSQTFSSNFIQNTPKLKNIKISGIIGNSIHFTHSSGLTRASIESILFALSETATGQTLTLPKMAVDAAFETTPDLWDGSTSETWLSYVSSVPNWTISLM